jgi:putative ABC transport system substrate-binding protein
MRRRQLFLAVVGSLAAATPLDALAQQPAALPVIGFLNGASPGPFANRVEAFREGLREVGFVENQNVIIEFRWAEGRYDQLPALVGDLINRQVAVILATGGSKVARVAKQATSSIPIVFTAGIDPIQAGLVSSIQHPGGNVTGVSLLSQLLAAKRFEVLHEFVPAATAIGLLVNPESVIAESEIRLIGAAGQARGLKILVQQASSENQIDLAFASLGSEHADALLLGTDAFFESRREQVVALAARHVLPAVFDTRDYVDAGGLSSYGPDYGIAYREAGAYCGRILRGAKPGDLPVLQLSKIELVINLKTAKVLGLTVPQSLLARADEVIE